MPHIFRADAHATSAHTTSAHRRPLGRRLTAGLLATVAALGLSLASAAPALAHDELVGVSGAFNADHTAFDVTLSFNNKIMDIGEKSIVKGEDGKEIAVDPPKISDRDVVQSVPTPQEDQSVSIDWRVVSSDGHPIQGRAEIQFAGDATTVSIPDPRFVDEDADASAGTDGAGEASGNLANDTPNTGDAAASLGAEGPAREAGTTGEDSEGRYKP